jgi:hypothetical protein
MPARVHKFKRITIDKNVDLPKVNNINAPIMNMLKDMNYGDSVLVQTKKEAVSLRVILGRLKFKSTRRKVHDGYRIWRIK